MNLEFAKVHEGAKAPEKAHDSDAGFDVFWCPPSPEINGLETRHFVELDENASRRFETGLKFNIPEGWALVIFNRSGVASKKNVVVGACVVDEGYKGEVFIDLHNIGYEMQLFKPGDKIAQFLLIPVPNCSLTEVSLEDIINSERGEKCLGSSDAKESR